MKGDVEVHVREKSHTIFVLQNIDGLDCLWTRRYSLFIAHQKNTRQKGLYFQRVLGSFGRWLLRPTS